jgi:hypothetical protein
LKIELNNDEANVLINLIDVAVKAAGLQAAEAGLHFRKKIEDAAKEPAVDPVEVNEESR